MIRLIIVLLIGFEAISIASTKLTCPDFEYLCGNICSPSSSICECGENSFELNYQIDFVCISDTNCTRGSDGKYLATTQAIRRQDLGGFSKLF